MEEWEWNDGIHCCISSQTFRTSSKGAQSPKFLSTNWYATPPFPALMMYRPPLMSPSPFELNSIPVALARFQFALAVALKINPVITFSSLSRPPPSALKKSLFSSTTTMPPQYRGQNARTWSCKFIDHHFRIENWA